MLVLTLILIAILNKSVICDDIVRFNWGILTTSPFSPPVGTTTTNSLEYTYNDRSDHNTALESEFGTFQNSSYKIPVVPQVPADDLSRRRPKFLTRRYSNINTLNRSTYINKIHKFPDSNTNVGTTTNSGTTTKERINGLLKTYLTKLYVEKYNQKPAKIKKIQVQTDDGEVPPPMVDKINPQESKFVLDSNSWKYKFANKFLSLFTVVQFANSQCQATSASGQYFGTCYHQTECTANRGTSLGNCANGYGVCCVFISTCGGTSSRNCTYFESPGYPNYDPPGGIVLPPTSSTISPVTTMRNPSPTPDPRLKYHEYHQKLNSRQVTSTTLSCTISIYKINHNVQQVRIDFLDLELAGPTNGTCVNERLVISGQNVNDQIPAICGYNTGQHVYVDVSILNGPLHLSVLSSRGDRKRYRIRICQIATNSCANSNNCLQYYTGITGTISSFNYDQAAMSNRSTGGYFNNLNYAICIRKEAGYCSITYTNMAGGNEYPFQLRNINAVGQNVIPPGQAGAEIFNCPDDYVIIGGVRLCGDKFNDGSIIEDFRMNAPVTDSSAGPIVVSFRTNMAVNGRGFKLFYTQNRCVNM